MRMRMRTGSKLLLVAALVLATATAPAAAETAPDPGYVTLPPYQGPAPVVEAAPASAAPTVAGRRLLARLDAVAARLAAAGSTAYQAATVVDERRGSYRWDCSGMMNWLLQRSAPAARRRLGSSRPVARDYVRVIAAAPMAPARGRAGWQQLRRVDELQPGDVFAFLRAPISLSKVSGHVGVVVSAPVAVPGWPGVYAVRIVDSTRARHDDDSRAGDGIGGFGYGTITFGTDDAGAPIGYGWAGTAMPWIVKTRIVLGRVVR
jgi:hypothetical protein